MVLLHRHQFSSLYDLSLATPSQRIRTSLATGKGRPYSKLPRIAFQAYERRWHGKYRKDTINGELDIYIPSLKLAFELNGIFHYEPIYNQLQLEKTQNNDQRKFQACLEKGIELCIIDVSKQKYFKESTSQQYLKIITDIINQKTPRKGIELFHGDLESPSPALEHARV